MKETSIYDIYEQTAQKIKDKSRLTETISSVMALINTIAFSLILYFGIHRKSTVIILCILTGFAAVFFLYDLYLTKASDNKTISRLFYSKPKLRSAKIVSFTDDKKIRTVIINDGINDNDYPVYLKITDAVKIKEMKPGDKVEVLSYQEYFGSTSKTRKVLVINGTVL